MRQGHYRFGADPALIQLMAQKQPPNTCMIKAADAPCRARVRAVRRSYISCCEGSQRHLLGLELPVAGESRRVFITEGQGQKREMGWVGFRVSRRAGCRFLGRCRQEVRERNGR